MTNCVKNKIGFWIKVGPTWNLILIKITINENKKDVFKSDMTLKRKKNLSPTTVYFCNPVNDLAIDLDADAQNNRKKLSNLKFEYVYFQH